MRLDSTPPRVGDWREELRVGESATIGPSEMKNVQLSLGDHRLRLEVDNETWSRNPTRPTPPMGCPSTSALGLA